MDKTVEELADTKVDQAFELKKNFLATFESPAGQKVLNHLMHHFGFMKCSYRGDLDDTVFNEGQRNVLLYIVQTMGMNVGQLKDAYIKKEEGREYGYFE